MLAWLNEHGALLQAAVGIVTALVWVIYLHIFVSGQKRQRRNEILITVAGQRDLTGISWSAIWASSRSISWIS